jgi:hypothetical protein
MIRHAPRPLTPGREASGAPCHSHAARNRMRQCVLGAAGGLLVTFVAACSSLTCQPVPVTVAEKEERSRLDMLSHGTFSSETGQLKEVRVPEVVREYWVRAQDGTWYRVSAERFRAVEVGGTVELCR